MSKPVRVLSVTYFYCLRYRAIPQVGFCGMELLLLLLFHKRDHDLSDFSFSTLVNPFSPTAVYMAQLDKAPKCFWLKSSKSRIAELIGFVYRLIYTSGID